VCPLETVALLHLRLGIELGDGLGEGVGDGVGDGLGLGRDLLGLIGLGRRRGRRGPLGRHFVDGLLRLLQ